MICLARPRLTLAVAVLSALLLLAPACAADPDDSVATSAPTDDDGGSGDGPEITVPAELEDLTGQTEVTIRIADNSFDPRNVKVSPGTEITWVNEGANQHNVTPADDESGVIADPLERGDTYSQAFPEATEFPYYCSFHGTATVGQTGFVLVE